MSWQALLLDRDGVVIENRPDYIRSWSDVVFLPNALQALARVRETPYRIVVITNQSAVGRGLLSLEEAESINRRLTQTLEAAGIPVHGIFLCPHRPEDACSCRKPQPGLILQAARSLSLDLSRSILVGDALSDLQAGLAAGVGTLALVRTGRGHEQEALLRGAALATVPVFDDISQAIEALVFAEGSSSRDPRPHRA
jgi:D-glycero-D-manno-heptose 1,7-bisphosphate phosphatase